MYTVIFSTDPTYLQGWQLICRWRDGEIQYQNGILLQKWINGCKYILKSSVLLIIAVLVHPSATPSPPATT